MSRPRKVDYNEVISAWLRSGDATMIAATMKLGKSTVYKILHKHEYGLLGVDGGEPLGLADELRPVQKELADSLHANTESLKKYGTPTVAVGEHATVMGENAPKPMFFRDGDILMLNDGLLSLMGPGLCERAEEEGFDPTPISEAYRRLSPDAPDHYSPTPLPTKKEVAAMMARAKRELDARQKAFSANLRGKTAAMSNKIAMDRECGGKQYHVIARFPVWPVVLAVAVVALGAWLWRAL